MSGNLYAYTSGIYKLPRYERSLDLAISMFWLLQQLDIYSHYGCDEACTLICCNVDVWD